MKDFNKKVAFIVGGSSGIGLASAGLLCGRGADIIVFSRNRDKLVRAVENISEKSASIEQTVAWAQMDVADRYAVDRVLDESVKQYGVPDILVNCAGRAYPRHFEDIPYTQFDETMRVNLYGMWHTTQKLVPLMKANGGYIVNVSSVAGFVGVFGYTDYCASKFAVMGFSEALRSELKQFGITVSILCPPDTDTPALEEEEKTKPEETRAISENAGLMQPDDVAVGLLKGMRRKQPIIIPGFQGKVTHLSKRMIPGMVEAVMDRTIKRLHKD